MLIAFESESEFNSDENRFVICHPYFKGNKLARSLTSCST